MPGWWAALAVGVAWEAWALATGRETLSSGARRALQHPICGPLIVGTAAAGLWHLALMIFDDEEIL